MGTKTVIFDLDGTLLNTISDLGYACNYALDQEGLPTHEISEYVNMVGNGLRKLIELSAPNASPETIDRLITHCKRYYNGHSTDTTQPYPGMSELLETLASHDVKLAVASNKYQEAVDKIIRHFFPDIPFAAIMGQIESRPIKPDPAIINVIMEQTASSPEETVMVGDSAVDIETARRAGVISVAVKWGFSPEEDLRDAMPTHLVSSAEEILSLL